MLGKIFGILCLISLIYGTVVGNGEALGNAVLDGAAGAVELTLSLCGMMCLWCGIMRVLQEAGLIDRLAKGFAPILRLAFPHAAKTGEGMGRFRPISARICWGLATRLPRWRCGRWRQWKQVIRSRDGQLTT